jgi:hypothetical protein
VVSFEQLIQGGAGKAGGSGADKVEADDMAGIM